MDAKEIGSRLRAFRKEAGLTQEELAHRSGMHVTFVSKVERGVELPSLIALDRFANALGLHPARFLGGEIKDRDLPVYRKLWGAVSGLPAHKAAYLCDLLEAALTILEARVDEPRKGRLRSSRKDLVGKVSQAAESRGGYKRKK
ncbi:MAG: helix-turn-helix domain-containing protein [Armatimonadetes bacterium]|nr:helix-turn-helix domain-containing protein [Armatimonadota bacterium]